MACTEKFPAAAVGAPLDGAADPGVCVSLHPGTADRTMDEKISPIGVATNGRRPVAADQGGHGDLPGGSFLVTTIITAVQKDLLKRLGVPRCPGYFRNRVTYRIRDY